jgi:large subunit ribosomal protein L4
MAVIEVKNIKGEKVSEVEMPDSIFNVEPKKSVLHEVVCMQLAAKRSGTASVKGRSDVNRTGAKPFRQKGTGRARQGDAKSPLMRGGGVVFGPNPRSYTMKVHKKVKRLAL